MTTENDERTHEELLTRAKELNISGRSQMKKEELADAVAQAEASATTTSTDDDQVAVDNTLASSDGPIDVSTDGLPHPIEHAEQAAAEREATTRER